MDLVAIVFFTLTATVLTVMVRGVYVYNHTLGVRGFQLVQALTILIHRVQIHRGLLSAYKMGDADITSKVISARDSVVEGINNIASLSIDVTDNENWQGITRHWATLSAKGEEHDVLGSYEQHCRLIGAILQLVFDTAYKYKLCRGAVEEVPYWLGLMRLAESLGQLRALGLIYLLSEGRSSERSRSFQGIDACLKHLDNILTSRLMRECMNTDLRSHLMLLDSSLVKGLDEMSSRKYFDYITEYIEQAYDELNKELLKLRRD